ncbi:hypothetical protein A6R68_20191 [Neotoma lepida]|uniref:Uncharacterized protein n=1 Tax=Neotoma lepida TaxID=56216 RepID=A0A1A6HTR8_NEOLE|nr:hypothetical protein A6R68_20191 [Neotoma lepida]
MIQTVGLVPRHVIVLNAPDTVLIERNVGKRIDPVTGGMMVPPPPHPKEFKNKIYHTTFDWPPEPEVQNRLIEPEGISEIETAKKLLEYHRNIIRILPSYPKILKTISADQPCVDVFYQALTYVQTGHRCNAPFTPKVLLCGPLGSGKSLQAALLAQRYGLVDVCCGQLLKEAVAAKSSFGELIQPFFEKKMTGKAEWHPRLVPCQGCERTSEGLIARSVLEPPCVREPGVILLDAACNFTPVLITLSDIVAARAVGDRMPDSIITKALAERLSQQDCIQKGWVLHGFPRDLDQARMLTSMGYSPNRFGLNILVINSERDFNHEPPYPDSAGE